MLRLPSTLVCILNLCGYLQSLEENIKLKKFQIPHYLHVSII